MTYAMEEYIGYLKWRDSDNCSIVPEDIAEQSIPVEEEPIPLRSIAEVEAEINIFKKWNRDVPDELLDEYNRLLGM